MKNRKKILTGLLDHRLKEIVDEMAEQFNVQIIQQETDRDHIHIVFSSRPSLAPSRFINSLKTVVDRKIQLTPGRHLQLTP